MKPTPDTLRLPALLAEKLGIDRSARNGNKGRRSSIKTRKDQRKADRQKKKGPQNGQRPDHHVTQRQSISTTSKSDQPRRQREESEEEDPFDISDDEDAIAFVKPSQIDKSAKNETKTATTTTKSILKKSKKVDPIISRSPTPPRIISQAIKDKLQDDDDEIAFLEKKLGLKSKKLPQSFTDDGLDELLSGLDALDELDDGDDVPGQKRKRTEEDEWLAEKRQKALKAKKPLVVEEDEDSDVDLSDLSENNEVFDDPDDLDDPLEDDDSNTSDDAQDDDSFDGFDSDENDQPEPRIRENPYIAPTTGAKYIPPSLRKRTNDTEDLTRLRRQATGLINRLSEANLISILADVENLYRSNARQHVTTILIELLLSPICEPTSARDTDVILRGGFIMAIYKIIGTDFGAQVIQRIVELFDQFYNTISNDAATNTSKQPSNLITLLCELYNFQMIRCNLIFDYIRLFLNDLTELNAELLLKITRMSGQQLRQDDPSSLKDIVILLRPAIAKIGEANISVRTKFMVDAINDLKNNKKKTGASASAVVSEHTVRMKKTIGTLNTRSLKGSEPLSIGLKDIQESDKKGKWWLVGASWAGNTNNSAQDPISEDTSLLTTTSQSKSKSSHPPLPIDASEIDLQTLARTNGMNTQIRRSIFITLLCSLDYHEAQTSLTRLHLTNTQRLEIPKVLLHCAAAEAEYNHYYTLLARCLCSSDRKVAKAFQFALWDVLGRCEDIDDNDDDDNGEQRKITLREIVSLAKLYGFLIASGHLTLLVLKNVNFMRAAEDTQCFLEVLFITLFVDKYNKGSSTTTTTTTTKDEKGLRVVMEGVKGLDTLILGVLWFLKNRVRKTGICDEGEKKGVKWGCKFSIGVLEALRGSGGS